MHPKAQNVCINIHIYILIFMYVYVNHIFIYVIIICLQYVQPFYATVAAPEHLEGRAEHLEGRAEHLEGRARMGVFTLVRTGLSLSAGADLQIPSGVPPAPKNSTKNIKIVNLFIMVYLTAGFKTFFCRP